jgi:hypothetical protein
MPMLTPCHNRFSMGMLMMLVMHMFMVVQQRLMGMPMLMTFSEMQPNAASHQKTGDQHLPRHIITQHDRQERTDKRRHGKISAGSRRTQVAQANDKQG